MPSLAMPSPAMPSRTLPSLAAAALALVLLATGCGEAGGRTGSATFQADDDWSLRSERSGFEETASHEEVVAYLEQAARSHPSLHLTRFGYTNEGRMLPLLVAGPVEDATPETVRAASGEGDIPVVYLQGGIHSGEAAGKEGLLRLVRELAHDERPAVFDELILLIGPIYNADGNERIDLGNRPRQHGPIGGMGTRANAQGLDLNRDQMKLDSPEARSLAGLMTAYDPHVIVDLHTTNGTRHAYHLTYSPPLHPATPEPIDALLRDELLPAATEGVESEHGWHFYHYGNVSTRDGERAWFTFDHRPRFVTNYAGLRNRMGVLSEAYSYATFEDRILASERFVDEILEWTRENGERVIRTVREEDTRDLRGMQIAVRGGFPEEAETHPILMGAVEEEAHPYTGEAILRRLDVVEEEPMAAFIAFVGTEQETVPDAYLVPRDLDDVIDRLRAHGVQIEEPGAEPWPEGEMQRFAIQTIDVSEQPFQGRNEVVVEGAWEPVAPAGAADPAAGAADPAAAPADPAAARESGEWLLVPMDQPLARLAFLLLEPRADDGLLNWGLMEGRVEAGGEYPLRRVLGEREQ